VGRRKLPEITNRRKRKTAIILERFVAALGLATIIAV
jgi:hypothetical protein